jgi:hypothetical protein
MLVLNLCCGHEHSFEGWFGSAADFESQLERGLVACPICADAQIKRLPTAPRLNVAHLRAESAPSTSPIKATPPVAASAALSEQQRQMLKAVAQLIADTDDVGERFAEEARRIHYGETKAHGIRGQATTAEVADLVEEGIAVLPLALPVPAKGRLQ